MTYRLVAFGPARLNELTDLWEAAWSAAMPAIAFDARRGWLIDHLTAMQERGVDVACAVDEAGAVAGFITLDRTTGHIDQLAVAPEAWGSGAAETLLAHAKHHAPGRLWLEVNQDNPRAVRFYEKNGFRREAESVNPNSGLKTWIYRWQERE